jgi:hypothetical protein
MTLTKGFTDELKMLNAESVIGASANELLHNTMARVGKHVDNPLRMYAAATPDSKLYFSANVVEVGDGAGKSTLPIEGNIGTFVATNIDMQTGVVTGGTVNMLGGGSFALPASTLNYYRRLCFNFQSDGSVQANFSAESATTGGLSNPGTLFNAMTGLPVGYIDLQCDNIVGQYRTAGSSSSIIENKIGSYYAIMRFAGGGGGGAAFGLIGDVQTLDATKSANAGTSPKVLRADHVHPITTGAASGLDANSTNASGSSASLTRADHSHAVASGTPSAQTPDATNNAGSSANFAKADHIHNIATAVPTDVGSSNSQGASTTAFVKADHVHKGLHSLKVETGGTQRFGDLIFKKDVGITITDNGDGSFSFKGSPPSLLDPTYESTFTYYTRSDFAIEQKTFFDSTTGTDDILATGKITLNAAQNFISKELTGTVMIADSAMVNAIQVKSQYNVGAVDTTPTITGSVDGGASWVSSYQQYSSGRNVITDINFPYSATPIFDAGTPNGSLTSAYYIAEIFQPTYRMALTAFGAYVKLTSASTAGSVVGKLYAVSGGVPTTLIATSKETMAVGTDITVTSAYKVFSFNPQALDSATQYALVLYSTGMSVTLSVDQVTSAPAYILGSATAPDGTTWTGSGSTDLAFQIYGTGLDVRIKIVSGTASSELSGFGVEMVNNTPTTYSGESAYETRVITSTEASTGTITLTSIRFTPGAHQLHCNYNGHDFMAPDFLEMGGQVVQFPVSFFTLGDIVKFYVTYGINNSVNTPLTINNIVSSNSTLGSIQIPSGYTLDKPWMEIPLGATVSGAGNIETTGLITGAGTLTTTGTILSTGYAPTQPKVNSVQEYTATKGVSVQGRIDGGVIPSGYIGETLEVVGSALNLTTSWQSMATLTIPAGRWRLSGFIHAQAGGGAPHSLQGSLSTSLGSGTPGVSYGYSAFSSVVVASLSFPGFTVNLTTSTTYILGGAVQAVNITGTPYCVGSIMAQRIG